MGGLRVGLRARIAPSRTSHTAAGARIALTEGRLPNPVNLTHIDSPLTRKGGEQVGTLKTALSQLQQDAATAVNQAKAISRARPPH